MSKRNKKQPYRNALLKLKKERNFLESLYKENQRLNANLLYKRKEAQTLLYEAAQEKDEAAKIRLEAENELQKANPYHPMLMATRDINANATYEPIDIHYALTYRLAAPSITWNESENRGVVKITCHKQPNRYETLAYGFSEALIKSGNVNDYQETIKSLSEEIAEELIKVASTKLKEWYNYDKKGSYSRRIA
jgi:hypothetical protein